MLNKGQEIIPLLCKELLQMTKKMAKESTEQCATDLSIKITEERSQKAI